MSSNKPATSVNGSFEVYLRATLATALADEADGSDGGEFAGIRELCRRGVVANWSILTAQNFMNGYLWVVGSSRKKYDVRLKYCDDQVALFRDGDAERIFREQDEIRKSWSMRKCYLSPDMVESVIATATKVFEAGWDKFRDDWILLPADPESEHEDDWHAVHSSFCEFPQVREALAWYLIRNVYGAPFFKPDVHIMAIARHFFSDADPLTAMRAEVKRLWPIVCQDARLLPLHFGEVDHIFWWHKRKNPLP